MEQINSTYQLMELISKPAFCVKDGTVQYVNQAAKSMQVEVGTPIEAFLSEDYDAYRSFQNGCLYVTVRIAGISCGASITKSDEFDFFTLEDPTSNEQLRALSLAGQQLRIPLANLVATMYSICLENSTILPYSDQIRRGIYQLHRMINNMSDAACLGADTSTDETLDFGSIVSETIEKSAAFLKEAGVAVRYKGLDHPVYTRVNRNLLERAIFNMISNAVKFSIPQSPISVDLSQKGNKLYLSICNQSKNPHPEMLANAFCSYQRKPSVEDSRLGIGLGMPLIRAAAQAHGGTVLIDQPDPECARVTLTLSIREPESPTTLCNPLTRFFDYAGGRDHALLELSEVLPSESYRYESD